MIVGFLGKGGSGKSSLATLFAHGALRAGKRVLAIDADHNMDFSYNLGAAATPPYLGDALEPLLAQLGHRGHYSELFTQASAPAALPFSFEEPFTKAYAQRISDQLLVMMTGPQSERVLHGEACSHSLATVLKAYLPLLMVDTEHVLVVDEKASVDAVSTGIPTGFDLAVIAVEPRDPSIRAAQQIARTLDFYEVPYVFVANKIQHDDERTQIEHALGTTCAATVAQMSAPAHHDALSSLFTDLATHIHPSHENRLARTRRKFVEGKLYSTEL